VTLFTPKGKTVEEKPPKGVGTFRRGGHQTSKKEKKLKKIFIFATEKKGVNGTNRGKNNNNTEGKKGKRDP